MAAEGPNLFLDAVILLGGATVAAPLFKKIGLGTVLGYIAVGLLLGPVIGMFRDGEEVLHVAEIGVVLLLFLVGLELEPRKLWDMRREIFGLGASQVFLSGFVLAGLAFFFLEWRAALVAGFGLALSSTAFALQLLQDRGEEHTPYGQRSFSVLLFQDLAIAPLLVGVSLLAAGSMEMDAAAWGKLGLAIGAVAVLVLAGRYVLNPLFDIIARTGAKEAMIAAALFVVMGAAVLMQYAGLSMAMGAFIAGVMLAESNYRHELEADIEPFRGILLGLFFIAVGLAVDLNVVIENVWVILAVVPVAMAVKGAILYGVARLFGSDHPESSRVAGLLPQHGEFGFVMFSAAAAQGLLDTQQSSLLIACVTLSMALTPLTLRLGEMLAGRGGDEEEQMDEDFDGAGGDVLMVGFSRMGQITAQALLAAGAKVTVLDSSADRIRQAENFKFRIYFGDGTRKNVLESAGIEKAKLVAVMTRDPRTTNEVVELVRAEFPHVKLYVRAYDRGHALQLMEEGCTWQIRETFESALVMGAALLEGLGYDETEAEAIVADVRERDARRLEEQREHGIMAGMHHLHFTPEPKPLEGLDREEVERKAQANDPERTEQALGAHEHDADGHDADGQDTDGQAKGEREPAE